MKIWNYVFIYNIYNSTALNIPAFPNPSSVLYPSLVQLSYFSDMFDFTFLNFTAITALVEKFGEVALTIHYTSCHYHELDSVIYGSQLSSSFDTHGHIDSNIWGSGKVFNGLTLSATILTCQLKW